MMIYSGLILFVLIVGSIIYAAYFLQAKEYPEFASEYLKRTVSQYATMDNYTAHYVTKGSGSPVILVHGGGSWLYSYRNNITALSEHFKVYALDMPGHGYTTATDEPEYDLNTYADFIYDFMENQGLEKASIVGHSWGGGWAIYFASKYPDKVDKLILIGSAGLDSTDKSEWKYLNYPVLGEMITNLISLNATEKSLKNMVYNSDLVTELYAKEMFTPLSKFNNRRSQFLSQRNLDWKITDVTMEELNQQALLIFGDSDPYFDNDYANQMKQRLKNSTLISVKDSGHLPHEENSEEVNIIMLEFLLNQ